MLYATRSGCEAAIDRTISSKQRPISEQPIQQRQAHIRGVLLTASILAAPMAARAQPVDGLYIGAGAGGNIMSDQTLKSLTVPPALLPAVGGVIPLSGQRLNGHIRMKTGFTGEASIGWGFGRLTPLGGPRVELEGNYSQNNFSGVGLGGGNFNTGLFRAGGREQKYGVFLNAFWDFDVGLPWMYPYLGAGVGGQWANWSARFDNRLGLAAGVPQLTSVSSNDTQASFAYQAILGAAFPIAPVPGLSITTDFRFIGLTGQRNFSGRLSGVNSAGVLVPSIPTVIGTSENYNYTFMLGVRYAFNAAPPPPPPAPVPVVAPAPAPARSYLVFFDWDRADLTDRARQIIADAAQNSTRVQYTRLEVNGYTDTSGTPRYNQGLSIRRAQAVAAELVKDGVPRDAISIQGFGDTHLLVPTGPGVREAQNRRVEIIIR
jgi:OOP family OmpA-OmpF porin